MEKASGRIRAAGIVIRDDSLLVMFRRKNGREYYTFPGGTLENGESPQEAVVREIEEETTMTVEVGELLYELHRTGTLPKEYFYRCTYKNGTPALRSDSIEQKINDEANNFFEPKWVQLSEIKNIPLLPAEIAERLSHDLQNGFSDTTVVLDGIPMQ